MYDSLKVFDGTTELANLCGKSELPDPITSTSNSLRLVFSSDTSLTEKGFLIDFYVGPWNGGENNLSVVCYKIFKNKQGRCAVLKRTFVNSVNAVVRL